MCAGMGWWCMVWYPCSYVTPTSGWEREKKRNEMKGRKKSWTAMWLNLQILYWQQRRENRRDSKQASLAAAGMDGSHLLWWSFSDLSRGLEGELHYCPPTELRLSFWDGWRKHKGRIAWLNDLCPSKLRGLPPEQTTGEVGNYTNEHELMWWDIPFRWVTLPFFFVYDRINKWIKSEERNLY